MGTLTHGQSVQVTVTGSGTLAGTWNNTFSVMHQDPDPVVTNNGVSVSTVVGPMSVNLGSVYNVYGIFSNGSTVTNGGFDTHDYAVSETLAGASQTWSGTTFALGAAGAADAVSGVTIPIPAGTFSTLKLLAAGVNSSQVNQPFVIAYADGATSTFTQSVSDWWTPQNYTGESKAVSMSYLLTPTGAQHFGQYYLYGYSFTLNPAKLIKSITLPNNRNLVVLAITMMPST